MFGACGSSSGGGSSAKCTAKVDTNPGAYVELGQRHRRGIAFVDPEDD
jgi:hypothetical protein